MPRTLYQQQTSLYMKNAWNGHLTNLEALRIRMAESLSQFRLFERGTNEFTE